MVDHRSISNPILQAAPLCSIIDVKTADCAPPRKLIHVVSESCAGYLFSVYAFTIYHKKKVSVA